MSDIQTIMKFEFLPNEILMECFQYLNPFEIFHSFDQLNNRFDTVIQNILLYYVNFEDVNKSIFDQFCKRRLSNSQIKKSNLFFKISKQKYFHHFFQLMNYLLFKNLN